MKVERNDKNTQPVNASDVIFYLTFEFIFKTIDLCCLQSGLEIE